MIHPRIDELLENVDSRYALVIVAAKRARQINNYHHQLGEGTFDDFPPPLVESRSKNYLTMALEETAQGKIRYEYRRLVGERTRRASEAAIAYDDAGSHEVKGKADPVQLYRALRVIAARGGALRSGGLEPPFVGRTRELRLVKELFHACAEDRTAHLVSVVGAAGNGKSRLAWEFYKYIDGLADVVLWHRGRCLPYGEGVTYWALAEMVRMRAGIAEGDDSELARAKLRESVETVVPDAEERTWIEPRLAQLLGLEERQVHEREDVFAGWRRFFERMAEQQPVILTFDDMQWADPSLLDFVEYLLEWSRHYPIFVLALARPELVERNPEWGAGKRNFTSLGLEPLPSAAMDALLSGLVPGLPEELTSRILGRAEGVPLYAVETVRMLLDRGLVRREAEGYRLVGAIGALDVLVRQYVRSRASPLRQSARVRFALPVSARLSRTRAGSST